MTSARTFPAYSKLIPLACLLYANVMALPVYAKEEPQDRMVRAIEKKDTDTVLKLLKAGFDPNIHNREGQKLLHLAARSGDTQTARVLLKQGAEIDSLNKYGETPLMLAAIEGQLEMVKLLYRYEAKINPSTDWTPLCYAASGGFVPILEFLIQSGADLDRRCVNGISPLMMAIRQHQSDAALYLLNHGASATDQSADGSSVWQWAKKYQDKAVLDKLKSLHLEEE